MRTCSAPFITLDFQLMIPPTHRSTLFPYTTLFRSPPSDAQLRVQQSSMCVRSWRRGCIGKVDSPDTFWTSPSKPPSRSEEHTSELQSLRHLVCRLLLEKKKDARGTRSVFLAGDYHQ